MSDESILLRLEAQGKRAPRVLLRQGGSPGAPPIETCGRYEILGALAQGGVGEVLRGRDTDLGRDVAIKVLREGHLANPEMLQRFVDEAQIAGQLQHPGVVPVYELGLRADRRPYIAMKLVKGRTLAAMLHEGADRRRLLQVFEQICRTVAYAHGRGVVHRDLKPSNVMVGAFGEVQILDWGFAKVLARGGVADERRPSDVTRIATVRSGGGSESVAGSVMGTPAYMPPEQALGHVDELDERSDVFALGAILCEILTGKPPYTGDDLLAKAAEARLGDAHARLDACGEHEMASLARRCLSPLRADRPREATVVAEGVQGHLAAVEERAHAAAVAAAEAEEAAERARAEARQQRRARGQTILLGAAVLLAVVVGAGSYLVVAVDRRDRTRRTADAVNAAILDAEGLRGEQAWPAATSAAEMAVAMARADDVDPGLRDRAQATLATIAVEADEALRAAGRRALEQAFLDELDKIRLATTEDLGVRITTDGDLVTAFRERGIDVTAPADAIAAIDREWDGVRTEIAATLDWWALGRTGMYSKTLVTISRGIDPDPRRDGLRDCIEGTAMPELRALRDAASEQGFPASYLRVLASVLLRGGDSGAAVAILRDAWRLRPDDFEVNVSLAWLLRRSNPDEAARFSLAAVALRPHAASARHALAYARLARGDLDGAVAAWTKVIALWPDDPRGHFGLGTVLCDHLGRHDDAIASLREAIRLRPDFAGAYYNLSVGLGHKGDEEGAIAACREAIRLYPDYAEPHNGLGASLARRGDFDGAIAEFRESLRLKPDQFEAYLNLGQALEVMGRFREALDAFRKADEAESRLPKGLYVAKELSRFAAGRAASVEWLAEIEERLPAVLAGEDAPRDAREQLAFAGACVRKGLATEALKLFEGSLDENGSSWNANTAYDAACAAALAGAKAADGSRCRGLALRWLRSWLSLHEALLATDPGNTARLLQWSRQDRDLVSVRDRIDELPEGEREEWRKLWADVDALLAQARDTK